MVWSDHLFISLSADSNFEYETGPPPSSSIILRIASLTVSLATIFHPLAEAGNFQVRIILTTEPPDNKLMEFEREVVGAGFRLHHGWN